MKFWAPLLFCRLFSDKIISKQRNKINIFSDDLKNIFESRTFCLHEDVEKLQKAGFAKGGSLDNAIVVNKGGDTNTLMGAGINFNQGTDEEAGFIHVSNDLSNFEINVSI